MIEVRLYLRDKDFFFAYDDILKQLYDIRKKTQTKGKAALKKI